MLVLAYLKNNKTCVWCVHYSDSVSNTPKLLKSINSGLFKILTLHNLKKAFDACCNMQERNVIVLANLKPRNMRGVKSNGMLMAASDASHENVELLEPPEGSVPGERIWFGSADEKENLPEVATPNQVKSPL